VDIVVDNIIMERERGRGRKRGKRRERGWRDRDY
jgi:hypothetical protein